MNIRLIAGHVKNIDLALPLQPFMRTQYFSNSYLYPNPFVQK